jgi:hypothetical protein
LQKGLKKWTPSPGDGMATQGISVDDLSQLSQEILNPSLPKVDHLDEDHNIYLTSSLNLSCCNYKALDA